jgi:hypothetical protein
MDTVIGDCDSASSGEDERMQRRRRYAIRTAMAAAAEAGISDNSSYAPRSSRSVPGQALLMFAALNVDAMVRSSLPHCGLFP